MEEASVERDLHRYLEEIWQRSFADIPRSNPVTIAYGEPWERRLGVIRLEEGISSIEINALLQCPQVPECVLVTTIAHELVHYTHGFGSLRPRCYSDPHANNVVTLELERRGLGETLRLSDAWIDRQWFSFYAEMLQAGVVASYASLSFPQLLSVLQTA